MISSQTEVLELHALGNTNKFQARAMYNKLTGPCENIYWPTDPLPTPAMQSPVDKEVSEVDIMLRETICHQATRHTAGKDQPNAILNRIVLCMYLLKARGVAALGHLRQTRTTAR